MSEKANCRGCGRMVTHHKDPGGRRSRRYAYKHRCPHGSWCLAGDRLAGHAHFNKPRCRFCAMEGLHLKKNAAPPDRKEVAKEYALGGGTYFVHEHRCKYCELRWECHVNTCQDPFISDCKDFWPTLECKDRK